MYSYDEETGMISLTRGDTLHIPITVTDADSGEAVELRPDDTITMTIRDSKEEGAILRLTKQSQNGMLHILPEDTRKMEFGSYYYDVEARFYTGDVYTFGPYKFKILPEVTY